MTAAKWQTEKLFSFELFHAREPRRASSFLFFLVNGDPFFSPADPTPSEGKTPWVAHTGCLLH